MARVSLTGYFCCVHLSNKLFSTIHGLIVSWTKPVEQSFPTLMLPRCVVSMTWEMDWNTMKFNRQQHSTVFHFYFHLGNKKQIHRLDIWNGNTCSYSCFSHLLIRLLKCFQNEVALEDHSEAIADSEYSNIASDEQNTLCQCITAALWAILIANYFQVQF